MQREKVIDGVLMDTENLRRTAEYSRTHNHLHRSLQADEVEQLLIKKAIGNATASKKPQSGEMLPAYDVWFVLDEFPPGTRFNYELLASEPPKYQLNFFVRLGRQANAGIVE